MHFRRLSTVSKRTSLLSQLGLVENGSYVQEKKFCVINDVRTVVQAFSTLPHDVGMTWRKKILSFNKYIFFYTTRNLFFKEKKPYIAPRTVIVLQRAFAKRSYFVEWKVAL